MPMAPDMRGACVSKENGMSFGCMCSRRTDTCPTGVGAES